MIVVILLYLFYIYCCYFYIYFVIFILYITVLSSLCLLVHHFKFHPENEALVPYLHIIFPSCKEKVEACKAFNKKIDNCITKTLKGEIEKRHLYLI